jgi:hypothetical protein
MPQLIEHIDAIARKKQRDVLYITFTPKGTSLRDMFTEFVDVTEGREIQGSYEWEEDPIRQKICLWLDKNQISWESCGYFANEDMMISYEGQIYVDIPYDENDANYLLVRDYLEHPDGSMRFESVTFWLVPLEQAMTNKHHDELGFWEKWADNF